MNTTTVLTRPHPHCQVEEQDLMPDQEHIFNYITNIKKADVSHLLTLSMSKMTKEES